jgi:hypothetical protein
MNTLQAQGTSMLKLVGAHPLLFSVTLLYLIWPLPSNCSNLHIIYASEATMLIWVIVSHIQSQILPVGYIYARDFKDLTFFVLDK